MVEPQKPFACTMADCGMTFTNEDHLHVHKKKHDMVLQLGLEQKAAFVADQTPTPTRFIRNCEEVGLFQDLTVNPFDEGFKRAMETKHGILSLENATLGTDDVLHTPQMVFPLIDSGDSALFSAPGNQRHITISRSSSDESGTIKEYETTTISKLTNEVTTISRIVGNRDLLDKISAEDVSIVKNTDIVQNNDTETVSYKNNIIKIHSNVEIRKDNVNVETSKVPVLIYTDSVIKDTSNVVKDVLLNDTSKLQVPDKVPPIMSQKSLDFVVDSLTSELSHSETVIEKDKQHCNIKINNDIPIKPEDNVKITNKTSVSTKKHVRTPAIYKTYVRSNLSEPVKAKSNDCEINNKKCVRKSNVEPKRIPSDDYEVIIKLPNGKQVRMKAVEETKSDPKEILRNRLANKVQAQSKIFPAPNINNTVLQSVLQIPTGTLIPVTLVDEAGAPINTSLNLPVTNTVLTNSPVTNTLNNKVAIPISKTSTNLAKLPIINNLNIVTSAQFNVCKQETKYSNALVMHTKHDVPYKPNISNKIKRRRVYANCLPVSHVKASELYKAVSDTEERREKSTDQEVIYLTDDENKSLENNDSRELVGKRTEDCDCEEGNVTKNVDAKRTRFEMESRCEASKRYRERLKESMRQQREENRKLKEVNRRVSLDSRHLREANQRLIAEKAALKLLITEHMRSCPNADDLRITQERLRNRSTEFQT